MEYTIKQGDTLSQIAQAQNTTVEALAKANQIADPNKIIAGEKLILPEVGNINKNIDISTNEITSGIPDLNTPTLEVKPDTTANAILDYITNEQLRIAEEKKKLEEVAKTSLGATTGTESLVELAQKTPTIDTSTIRTQQEQVSGATQLREDIALQSTKLAGIKGERDKLDIMEQNEIEALEKAGVTRGAIERETTAIQRRYASKKAQLSADLNAEASMLAAMQGNYTMAKEVADQAVEDYVYDYKQKVENFNNVFDIYSDLVNDLNDDEKEILKTAAENAQKELDNARKEKKDVLSLRLDYPNAGILATDTLDQATQKAEEWSKNNPSISQTLGSAETGYTMYDKYGNIIGTKEGVTSGGSLLTDTQILNSANKADMTREQFLSLPQETQDFFASGQFDSVLEKINQLSSDYGLPDTLIAIRDDDTLPESIKNVLSKKLNSMVEEEFNNQTIQLLIDKDNQEIKAIDKEVGKTNSLLDVDSLGKAAKALGYGRFWVGKGAEINDMLDNINNWIIEQRGLKRTDESIQLDIYSYLLDASNGITSASNPFYSDNAIIQE